jgi:hypothetical protein
VSDGWDPQKYVVLKREDYDTLIEGEIRHDLLPATIDPATVFVIREQDVFGPQALFGYSHTIQSALELDSLPDRRIFSNEERDRLRILADQLFELALSWQRSPKKVPD